VGTAYRASFLGEHADLHIQSKLCHHVALNGHSVMLAADSCAVELRVYEHVRKMIGEIDVLFLGMECDGARSRGYMDRF